MRPLFRFERFHRAAPAIVSATASCRRVLSAAIAAVCVAACSPSSLVDVQTPSNTIDPSQVKTASVAAQMRIGALMRMMDAFGGNYYNSIILESGMLTDELSETPGSSGVTADNRSVLRPQPGASYSLAYTYDVLQSARVYTSQAREALHLYADDVADVPRAWQGEMYALEGYTVLWFAELYCSGIPLSVAPLTGAQQPTRGFTTEELYTRAVALFDSAAAAGADSAQFVNLALVGKGRALLGLGRFAAADSAVRAVPTDFVYLIRSATSTSDGTGIFYFASPLFPLGVVRTQDHEGGNGLVWSGDPRTGVTTVDSDAGPMLWPAKYNMNAATGLPDPLTFPIPRPSIRLADGLEARLIQAEVALAQGDGSWLTTLNTLRATCVGSAACAPIVGLTSASLPPLTDPGTPAARLDTLMKERAMWLYLTAHREGDLRRLVRLYGRDRMTLWPTGTMSIPAYPPHWPDAGQADGAPYGNDTVFGPDLDEQLHNPLYGGCYDTNP